MRNIELRIEYDGTHYFGWQRQKNKPTIQEILENAIEKITKKSPKLIGSGRTDTGVHALGQVANFKTESIMSPQLFQMAINSILPKDIVVIKAHEVNFDFHSQFDSKSKTYLYRILNRPYPSALERYRAWFIPFPLNIENMKESSRVLLGEHDFRAFALSINSVNSTVRNVLNVSFKLKQKHIIEFEIEATGFLKRMVRLIVGTLIQVGEEKITDVEFKNILDKGEKTKFVRPAPPWGLFLKKVKY
ncbi:tRNA pseudouridine(38-40) synthase TruA [Desulfobacterota bacterium AH_259_B03_O07]|nr:tRNA pseudouridine(38-40) synthase TruA [Desulfobacterota bacterium AH_259_B03_O07]